MADHRPSDAPFLVTVVTPSFNQGRFLRRAIDSVLAQDYPALQVLVIDGGSQDESVDILRSYDDARLTWVSELDRGQSHAINKGFRRARGEVVAWLNSDDVYLPGAITQAVEVLTAHPEVVLVYGRGQILDAEDRLVGPFSGTEPFNLWRLLYGLDYILQPATFFRRSAITALSAANRGPLDEALCYAMDWDLWLRLAAIGEVVFLDADLACSREYGETKTSTGGWRRIVEIGRLMRRHGGSFWTPGVRLYAFDTLLKTVGSRLPSSLSRLLARAVRHRMRRLQEGLGVHADGWLGPEAALVVPRRWRRVSAVFEALVVPDGGPFHVRLQAEGRQLAGFEVDAPGVYQCSFAIPEGERPFVDIDMRSGFFFRPDPASGDRRRLSLLCRQLDPV